MATHNPAEDVVTHLAAAVGSLTSATNLFASLPQNGDDYPTPCVFVWDGPGAAPVPYMGAAGLDVYYPTVSVRVRGTNNTRGTTRDLARDIRDALHRAQLSGYISCVVNESAPIELGENDSAQPEYGLNIQLIYRE